MHDPAVARGSEATHCGQCFCTVAVALQVKLTDAADRQTRTFSGGMRRRLSVSAALLGDPQVVVLDEPTTGMDPISR